MFEASRCCGMRKSCCIGKLWLALTIKDSNGYTNGCRCDDEVRYVSQPLLLLVHQANCQILLKASASLSDSASTRMLKPLGLGSLQPDWGEYQPCLCRKLLFRMAMIFQSVLLTGRRRYQAWLPSPKPRIFRIDVTGFAAASPAAKSEVKLLPSKVKNRGSPIPARNSNVSY